MVFLTLFKKKDSHYIFNVLSDCVFTVTLKYLKTTNSRNTEQFFKNNVFRVGKHSYEVALKVDF